MVKKSEQKDRQPQKKPFKMQLHWQGWAGIIYEQYTLQAGGRKREVHIR